MFTRKRAVAMIAAIGIVTTSAIATSGEAVAKPSNPGGPAAKSSVHWSPCFKKIAADIATFMPPEAGPPTYECAVVPVPLDYDRPNGPTIQLSLVRLPALDPGARIGSMFINPGGPGGSGVDFAVFGAPFLYSPELRSQFDIVGFDPRGIARSTALKCFGNTKQAFSIFQSPTVAFPKTQAELGPWFADEARLADACQQRGNKVLEHMGTANVARDLDLLRAAVGDEQLTYAGYSYGSYLGQTYANMFPERVRALIIDGVLDPIAWSTGYAGQEELPFSSRLGSEVGAQATLDEFFRLCDEAGPELCAFAPNSADRYDALAAELLANEPLLLEVPIGPDEFDTFPFFYGDLIGFSLGAMYGSDSWFFFAMDLAFVEAAASGEAAPFSPDFSPDGGSLGYTSKRGFPRYFNDVEGFPAVACSDSDNPHTAQAWFDAAGPVSSDNYFRQIWTYASTPCRSFPVDGVDRYAGPWTAETANPVLVASTLYDPATAVEGALVANSLLPNSGLLLVEGWGHTTLGLSGCASYFSEQYLINQQLPPDGLVCPQDFNPFELFGPGGEPGELESRRLEARARFVGE